jgi:hypothetical protein
MTKTGSPFGILAISAALATQVHAASWEGSDDFSGTLAKWDTTFAQADRPTDGFFLSGGQLQYIRTVTTTNYESSGVLFWPKSLPSDVSWTIKVDAHLNPTTTQTSDPLDQMFRAALFVTESIEVLTNANLPHHVIRTSLVGDATGDQISLDGPDRPVAGRDFTLGVRFEAVSQIGTTFYYPVGQPSQLTTISNIDMSAWTNRLIMLDGISEYWAVGPGEIWLDNFKVYANTPPASSGTNVVANLFVALSGFQGESTASPVKIDNQAILSALNGTLTNSKTGDTVNNYFLDGYGKRVDGAKLIVVWSDNSDAGMVKVRQVVNRTNIVDRDVSPWLQVSGAGSVRKTGAAYTIVQFSLENGEGVSFSAQGFAMLGIGDLIGTSGQSKGVRLSGQIKSVSASVAGTGLLPLAAGASSSYTVLKGSVGITGSAVEVQ